MKTRIVKTGKSFCVVAVAAMLLLLVCNAIVAAQSSPAQTPKKPAGPQAAVTPDQREAQKHYRIALQALKDNDFATAADELTAASKLTPKNALIWYNLAVVESKKGDSAQSALDHLQRAISLGLPKTLTNDADELEAKLSYDVKKEAKKQALSEKLLELQKEFKDLAGFKCKFDNGQGLTWDENYSYDLTLAPASAPKVRIEHRFSFNTFASGPGGGSDIHNEKAELEFDMADISPSISVTDHGESQNCPPIHYYYLEIFASRPRGIHASGGWQTDATGFWGNGHQEGAYNDVNNWQLIFQNKDSADRVARTFTELIQMSAFMNQASTDKR